jgi:hypothetical protein
MGNHTNHGSGSNIPQQSPLANPSLNPNRPVVAADDPRARAAARTAALKDHWDGTPPDETDKFYIDPAIIPDGWEYQWKTWTVLGAENPSYQVALRHRGWDFVPATRHPEMMPSGWHGNTIERDGMRLMEQPKEIADESRALDLRRARNQVGQKEAQIHGTDAGQFERTKPTINRTYEHIPIPK